MSYETNYSVSAAIRDYDRTEKNTVRTEILTWAKRLKPQYSHGFFLPGVKCLDVAEATKLQLINPDNSNLIAVERSPVVINELRANLNNIGWSVAKNNLDLYNDHLTQVDLFRHVAGVGRSIDLYVPDTCVTASPRILAYMRYMQLRGCFTNDCVCLIEFTSAMRGTAIKNSTLSFRDKLMQLWADNGELRANFKAVEDESLNSGVISNSRGIQLGDHGDNIKLIYSLLEVAFSEYTLKSRLVLRYCDSVGMVIIGFQLGPKRTCTPAWHRQVWQAIQSSINADGYPDRKTENRIIHEMLRQNGAFSQVNDVPTEVVSG